ncbi:MAG: class I SAM-dependent methyltransferase [Bacteroidia bacterium]|nr:class I SAM-dependent methyltransferase [Bacteroidia bacterium]
MNKGIGPEGYYEKHYLTRSWHFYRGILAKIVSEGREAGTVLDLGAGVGYLVEACTRWGIECVGLEGSAQAVEMGRARFPDMELKQFLLSNSLPYDDESFACVIMNQVVEHLEPNVAKHCINESFRVLQPKGSLIIYSPSKFNRQQRLDDPTHINLYSPKELQELLYNAGFCDIKSCDSPLHCLGNNFWGNHLMKLIFKLIPYQGLSATANCTAFKSA